MNTAYYFNIIEMINDHIHSLLNGFVFEGYHAIAAGLKYPLMIAITIYIVLLGYAITQGWVSYSLSYFIKSALKIAVIFTFAMNWNFFSAYGVSLIQGGADELGGFILSGQHLHYINGVDQGLQAILTRYIELGQDFIKQVGWFHVMPLLEAIIIWAIGIIFVAVSLFYLNVSYIMLAILFTAAPLFIAFYLFPRTQGFFNRWLTYVVGYGLQIFFIAIVLGFVLNLIGWVMPVFSQKQLIGLDIVTFVPIILVTVLGVCLLIRVARLALEIGTSAVVISNIDLSLKKGTAG